MPGPGNMELPKKSRPKDTEGVWWYLEWSNSLSVSLHAPLKLVPISHYIQ